jgi:hypothetical protein
LDENFETFRYKEADIVGVTSFTAPITRACEIAGIYRERGVPTVIGGIHVHEYAEYDATHDFSLMGLFDES